MSYQKRAYLTPGRIIILSALVTIFLGALLLALPWSQQVPLSWWDALFTSTSAASVTGLMSVPIESFTMFGKLIILILIQIGGLGVITLSLFLISFIINWGLGTQFLAGQVLELDNVRGVRGMIKFIVGFTLLIELIGAIILFFTLESSHGLGQRIFYAIAHTVSCFCNAGITFMPEGLIPYKTNIPFLITTTLLILIGSLGFITWHELLRYARSLHGKRHFHLSLHSKIVLLSTLYIIIATCGLLWLLEYRHSFAGLPTWPTLMNIFFDAVSARSAGFSTLDMSTVRLPTIFIIILVSFIGSSPGSTGSGIKTTTFAIFIATIRSVITGRSVVEIMGRSIPKDQVFKAMSILSLSLTWIAVAIFALLVSEEGWNFLDIMFEAFSAFTNVGFTTGITPYLSNIGKLLTIIVMIIGRIGSLTLLLALRRKTETTDFHYPEEKVMLS